MCFSAVARSAEFSFTVSPRRRYSLEPSNRFPVLEVLLEATALVKDVVGVASVDEQVREDRDALAVITAEARLSSGLLLGLTAGAESGRCGEQQGKQHCRNSEEEGIDDAFGTLAHQRRIFGLRSLASCKRCRMWQFPRTLLAPTSPRKQSLMPSSPLRHLLRASGHALQAVVQIGKGGTNQAVIAQVARALLDHELIKVKLARECPETRFEVAERSGRRPGGRRRAESSANTVPLYRRHPKRPRFEGEAARTL